MKYAGKPLISGRILINVSFPRVPLAQYYPEYTGGTDADEGSEYILRRFERCIPRHDPQLYIQ